MQSITWNEIRHRALAFSVDWADARGEAQDKQSFWNDFFNVFGLRRRVVATFERPLKNVRGKYSFIDLFWPGTLLVEHKSKGASLARAESQAFEYIQDLVREGRQDEAPRWVIVSDFQRLGLYDLEMSDPKASLSYRYTEIPLSKLSERAREFSFMVGERPRPLDPEDPANFEATALLAGLHDSLKAARYSGKDLERLLVRVLFCLFAEDTGIFEPMSFTLFLERTKEDGSDLGAQLALLFEVLDTPDIERQKNLNEDLTSFPYVNGALFRHKLLIAAFTSEQRMQMLKCAKFHWERISPAVFGSLFQDVMASPDRRQMGAHYTSEKDILKVLRGALLDELRYEFEQIKADRSTRRDARLRDLQTRLRSIKVFDPACGCGNFLVLAYRELRLLEHEILVLLHAKDGQRVLDIRSLCHVDVDQFYGIEINEWPCRIAEVGMWLVDHQCNRLVAETFGLSFMRLPLKATPTIVHANALEIDWKSVLPPSSDVVVVGNPPFIGKKEQTPEQKAELTRAFGGEEAAGLGLLDYVCAWFECASVYMAGTSVRTAFVATSSITQGEQAGVIFGRLFGKGVTIEFAHRTFRWESEARGKAHVHCVIIGFTRAASTRARKIFDYDNARGEPRSVVASVINEYLVDGSPLLLQDQAHPLGGAPRATYGSFALDAYDRKLGKGQFTLDRDDYAALIAKHPDSHVYIRPFVGGEELLHGVERWCIWIDEGSTSAVSRFEDIGRRVRAVKEWRQSSNRKATRELAKIPYRFAEIRQPSSRYLAIPTTSSETRRYIPIAYLDANVVASNQVYVVEGATLYHFGILCSAMHMAWTAAVCGRLESRFRYSIGIVYNNFPWPTDVPDKLLRKVEEAAQMVLDARSACADLTLATMYDASAMPGSLVKAHAALDRAVDRCYKSTKFASDRERLEHLVSRYHSLPRPSVDKRKRGAKARKANEE